MIFSIILINNINKLNGNLSRKINSSSENFVLELFMSWHVHDKIPNIENKKMKISSLATDILLF